MTVLYILFGHVIKKKYFTSFNFKLRTRVLEDFWKYG